MSERMWVENIVVTPCSVERDLISSRNSCRPIGFQSRSRLVEKQQSWLVEKSLRQSDLLGHPGRVGREFPIRDVRQMEESQELVNAPFESFPAHTKHTVHITEKLTGGKLLGRSVSVRQIAANAANIQTIFDDVVVENSRGSARWTQQSQQYANRRRLA
jgi:hypothetical protein